jgi:acetyl-CoA synthetase
VLTVMTPARGGVIRKDLATLRTPPQLADYDAACATFTFHQARVWPDGLPAGGLNIAHEAVDRHADGARGDHVALRWLGRHGETRDYTYRELRAATNRFANALQALGVGRGDRVFGLAGRIPELYVAALGTLKVGAVFAPLFSAFGPEPVRQRLQLGSGRALVTTPSLYEKKVAPIRDQTRLEFVLLAGGQGGDVPGEGLLDLDALLKEAPEDFTVPATDPEDMALLHFTSGTTGTPKGAVHVHDAVAWHHVTARYALDLRPEDVYWCTADPGWVTGVSYGMIAPLTVGCTMVIDEAEFEAERWYRILAEQRVTVWYTAPTAVRMLMRLGADLPREHDLSALRFVASVGEPLNPEAVLWGVEALGMPIHDNWWQTETGGIMIANFAATDVRPGSMGRPLPGVEAAVVRADEDGEPALLAGHLELVEDPKESGILALRPGWPSMFRAYLNEEARYARCFVDGWYLSGDLARRDADGYFWFVGRADDVIKSAGHLIGPFEVESALIEHPAVAEAGVIGKPEPTIGAIVKAFVVLQPDHDPSEELRRELIGFARKRLGAAVAPREIDFMDLLPKTRSGKIMRRLLKARELGLEEGDLSTLETQS